MKDDSEASEDQQDEGDGLEDFEQPVDGAQAFKDDDDDDGRNDLLKNLDADDDMENNDIYSSRGKKFFKVTV